MLENRPDADLKTSLQLDGILVSIWNSLEEGAKKRNHRFHTGVIATIHEGEPEARTVVLRKAIPQQRVLIFHTDKRSKKSEAISANPKISWLFYDTNERVQLRLAAVARLHQESEFADEQWKNTQLMSRRCYLSLPPSTVITEPHSGLLEPFIDRTPTLEESEAGRENFMMVETKIYRIDWLWLNATGHRRAKFEWNGDELSSSWIVP